MRLLKYVTASVCLIALSSAAGAENHNDSKSSSPKLIVSIAVDQLSSDLFAEYRSHFTGGLKRLSGGAVFPSGYQSHAATETCPGHSTIMTGAHPARTGIIGNSWVDQSVNRDEKTVYCAEDERVTGASFGGIVSGRQEYVPSAWHLQVPTLGERLKRSSPESLNVAVAGKDRSALMMGGKNVDAIYWWNRSGFATHKDREVNPLIASMNQEIGASLNAPRPPYAVPAFCESRKREIKLSDEKSVGTYSFARPQGGGRYFSFSPDLDKATLRAASALVNSMKLGQRGITDILSVGLSATDYVGHGFGTGGLEMCIQLSVLDEQLGKFFDELDQTGIDYMVALTADHGGHDLPERLRQQGAPDAQRIDPNLSVQMIDQQVKEILSITSENPTLLTDGFSGDFQVSRSLSPDARGQVKAEAMKLIAAHEQVAAVIDAEKLAAMPMPSGPVDEWTLEERARASYHPDRSGDFIVHFKKGVTPIPDTNLIVATHGSPWDYDRRVPILFWRKGMAGFEQPLSVRTIDIAPTLAAHIGVEIPVDEIDGRCLDLDGGEGDSCQ